MTQEELAQQERQIYDPGFPAAPRFRPLSAPRAYQGRPYVRASTGGQVRKSQQNEQEAQQQSADRPARCASAPEKAFVHNAASDRQWIGDVNQPANAGVISSSDGAPLIGISAHSPFLPLSMNLTSVHVLRILLQWYAAIFFTPHILRVHRRTSTKFFC
jgi:hypothetical protein